LLADPDRAAAMGAAGREWATAQWRWDDLARRLSGLISG
jgi:phosphatidyl-myo-inositol dimannoside synthase